MEKLTLRQRYASRSPLGPKFVGDLAVVLTPIITGGIMGAPAGTLTSGQSYFIILGWSIAAAILRLYASTLTTTPATDHEQQKEVDETK